MMPRIKSTDSDLFSLMRNKIALTGIGYWPEFILIMLFLVSLPWFEWYGEHRLAVL